MWSFKLKRKTGDAVANVMKDFLKNNAPQKIEIDMGKEFYNNKTLKLFKKYNVKYFSISSNLKGAIIERYNRTQKSKLFKYFTKTGSYRWINILDELTKTYNSTLHSSTKYEPRKVSKQNEHLVRQNLYPALSKKGAKAEKPKFAIGESVRILRKDNIFTKGYTEKFTDEIFYISKIKDTTPITYGIMDFQASPIKGSFYNAELLRVDKTNDIYPIEKIVKRRTTSKGTEVFVKWKGYPSSANTWVLQNEITHKNVS